MAENVQQGGIKTTFFFTRLESILKTVVATAVVQCYLYGIEIPTDFGPLTFCQILKVPINTLKFRIRRHLKIKYVRNRRHCTS